MGKSILVGFDDNSSGSYATTNFASTSANYFAFTSCMYGSNSTYGHSSSEVESNVQAPFPTGTLSNLSVHVKTASGSGTSTVILRDNNKSGGNGAETFTITSAQTGIVVDSTHTDSITSGDLCDVSITPGSTSLVINVIAAVFTAPSGATTVVASNNTASIIALVIASTSPTGTCAPLNGTITILLSTPVQASTVTHTNVYVTPGTSGTPSYDGNLTITVPTSGQSNNTAYTVKASGLQDLLGNTIASFSGGGFTTVPVAPTVSGTSPSGTCQTSLSPTFTITFSQPIASGSVSNSTVYLTPAASQSASYSSPTTVSLNASSLTPGTQYTINVSGVTDACGQAVNWSGGSYTTTESAPTATYGGNSLGQGTVTGTWSTAVKGVGTYSVYDQNLGLNINAGFSISGGTNWTINITGGTGAQAGDTLQLNITGEQSSPCSVAQNAFSQIITLNA